jgi:hypothetical protein
VVAICALTCLKEALMFVSKERKKKEEKSAMSTMTATSSSWRIRRRRRREKKGEGWREKSYFAAPLRVFI